MTDDEALSLMLRGYSGHGDECGCQRCRDFRAGFHVALAHARRWRPLTSDDATWPASEQHVVLRNGSGERLVALRWIDDGEPAHSGWTHWLPLPPSDEVGGG